MPDRDLDKATALNAATLTPQYGGRLPHDRSDGPHRASGTRRRAEQDTR
jgi:hypothetical protein